MYVARELDHEKLRLTTPKDRSGRPNGDDSKAAFDSVSVNRLFGMTLLSCSGERAEVTLPLTAEYVQEEGVVHGGIIAVLADTTAVYAILPGLPHGKTMTSIEFKLNFLRPVVPEAGKLSARARVVKQGRRVAVCDVEVLQRGDAVAKGIFTYLVSDR